MAEIFAAIWLILPVPLIWVLFKYFKLRKELKQRKGSEEWLNSEVAGKTSDISALASENTQKDSSIKALAERLIEDNLKFITKSLTTQNYATSRSKLEKVVSFCSKHSFLMLPPENEALFSKLKTQYEQVVRKNIAREEQARIKERIREEQKLEREINAELKRLEAEKRAIAKALEKALKEAGNEHSVEVQRLEELLREAEEKNQRAMSQAQLTRSGHVYVISNIGSFGEGIFKIGMTRRLEPLDRVKELGDASVPFPFDVHMMISCDDAPALELALHLELDSCRINRVNYRKEFFRVNLDKVVSLVEENHGTVEYAAQPDAFEFREGLEMGPGETIHPSLASLDNAS